MNHLKAIVTSRRLLGVISLLIITLLISISRELIPLNQGTSPIQCVSIDGLHGAEDLVIDVHMNRLYISADHRRAQLRGVRQRGQIFMIDLKAPHSTPKSLPLLDEDHQPISEQFHPHGIDIIYEHGKTWLWVVNHHTGLSGAFKGSSAPDEFEAHSLDLFEVHHSAPSTIQLIRRKQLKSPLLTSPNDLVGVSTDEVYVTNDHGSVHPIGRAFEALTRRSWGGVVHFNRGLWKTTQASIAFANGIEITPNQDAVIVSSSNGDGLTVFKRNSRGALTFESRIPIAGALDNLFWDQHETLWVTLHPRPLRFLLHALSPYFDSPTEVISLPLHDSPLSFGPSQTRLGLGLPISGGSVSVVDDQTLWIGSVFESFILRCSL